MDQPEILGGCSCNSFGLLKRRTFAPGSPATRFSLRLLDDDFGAFVGVVWLFDTRLFEHADAVPGLQCRHGRIDGTLGLVLVP